MITQLKQGVNETAIHFNLCALLLALGPLLLRTSRRRFAETETCRAFSFTHIVVEHLHRLFAMHRWNDVTLSLSRQRRQAIDLLRLGLGTAHIGERLPNNLGVHITNRLQTLEQTHGVLFLQREAHVLDIAG